jgi:hypothetical protein
MLVGHNLGIQESDSIRRQIYEAESVHESIHDVELVANQGVY